ncbi:hypothetical protein ACS0TY_033856 [Phlomoides rotata]
MKHTDIVRDILIVHVSRGSDSRVWGNSISGLLTSRMAYDILRSPNPRAIRFRFSKQLGHLVAFISTLWSIWHARNKAVFDDIQPSIQCCMAVIVASIKETDQVALGHFSGSVRELLILGRLGLFGCPAPPTSSMVIRWRPPQAGWYKVNVDGSAPVSPGPLFVGAIFRNLRGFFVAGFSKSVGWCFPLEAELASILHAILFAFDYG